MIKLSKGADTVKFVDGKPVSIKVHPLKECIESIQEMVSRSEERVEELEGELKELRDNYDKDEEIAALKQKIAELEEQNERGFYMTEKECEDVEIWRKKHVKEAHFEYYFNIFNIFHNMKEVE